MFQMGITLVYQLHTILMEQNIYFPVIKDAKHVKNNKNAYNAIQVFLKDSHFYMVKNIFSYLFYINIK